jgi:hypothetical protein
METHQTVLTVGFLFVLPQVVGFAGSRISRRGSVVVWPLAATGVVGLLWAISAIVEYRAIEHARATGTFHCGEGMVAAGIVAVALMVFHFAVGAILGVLDQRARATK